MLIRVVFRSCEHFQPQTFPVAEAKLNLGGKLNCLCCFTDFVSVSVSVKRIFSLVIFSIAETEHFYKPALVFLSQLVKTTTKATDEFAYHPSLPPCSIIIALHNNSSPSKVLWQHSWSLTSRACTGLQSSTHHEQAPDERTYSTYLTLGGSSTPSVCKQTRAPTRSRARLQ